MVNMSEKILSRDSFLKAFNKFLSQVSAWFLSLVHQIIWKAHYSDNL